MTGTEASAARTLVGQCLCGAVRYAAEDQLRYAENCHLVVGSKAPWFAITDDLPQYQEFAVAAAGTARTVGE